MYKYEKSRAKADISAYVTEGWKEDKTSVAVPVPLVSTSERPGGEGGHWRGGEGNEREGGSEREEGAWMDLWI
jgi:hypothetical protein